MKLFEAKGISKRFYSNQALKSVDFDINAGEVHALAGENGAGKSTLMNILLGTLTPDSGEMLFEGKPYRPRSAHDALQIGISMIHQELELVPSMTVAENIWIGRSDRFRCHGLYSKKRCEQETQALIDSLKIDISPQAVVKTLSVAQMQIVELVRAISYQSKLVIMDEPTSSLSDKEIEILYRIVRDISSQGTAVIFISHKLDEIFEIANRVTVFRDGEKIATRKTEETPMPELIAMIAGRKMENLYPKKSAPIGDVVFQAEALCKRNTFDQVSFQVREGEILGIAGLVGAGRTEIMNGIFGISPLDSGSMYLNGKKIVNRSPQEAINNGINMVTEDRLRLGVVRKFSVKLNMTLSYFDRICRFGFINKKKENAAAVDMASGLGVKTANINMPIWSLSGGNQQKVLIGRALLTQPKLLILDEPTRGVDVGAKYEIYMQCSRLAAEKHAIILISSDLEEVLGMSDRVLVVCGGTIVGEHNRGEADESVIISEMFGILPHNTEKGGRPT